MKSSSNKQLKYLIVFFAVSGMAIIAVMLKTLNYPMSYKALDTSVETNEISSGQSGGPVAGSIDKPETGDVTMGFDALKKRQAELSGEIKTIQKQLDELSLQSAADAGNPETTVQEDDPLPDIDSVIAGEEQQKAEAIAQTNLIEDTLEAETLDAGWSDNAVGVIEEVMNSELNTQEIELRDADCRSTMCRINVGFKSGAVEDGIRNLTEIMPWNGEIFFSVDDVNSGEAVVFIAREGHQLPRL